MRLDHGDLRMCDLREAEAFYDTVLSVLGFPARTGLRIEPVDF